MLKHIFFINRISAISRCEEWQTNHSARNVCGNCLLPIFKLQSTIVGIKSTNFLLNMLNDFVTVHVKEHGLKMKSSWKSKKRYCFLKNLFPYICLASKLRRWNIRFRKTIHDTHSCEVAQVSDQSNLLLNVFSALLLLQPFSKGAMRECFRA